MKRVPDLTRCLEFNLLEVTSADEANVEGALVRFSDATPHNNKTFCKLLRREIAARRLSAATIERLSVWCHTNQPPAGVSAAAADLAIALLGHVPPRLRGVGTTAHVADYPSELRRFASLFD